MIPAARVLKGARRRRAANRRGTAALAAAAIVLTASACGSGSGGTGTAADASTQGPIKIMVIGTLQSAAFGFPQSVDGAKAAALAIHKARGIHRQQGPIL